jgi:hypothetical protein
MDENTPTPGSDEPTQPSIPPQPTPPQVPPVVPPTPFVQQAQARAQDAWRRVQQQFQARTSSWSPAARIAAIAGAGLVSLCLVCGLCSAAIMAMSGGGGATVASATHTPKGTSVTSAPSAQATNTPAGPAKVSGPYLGTTESDFQAKYGAPVLKASLSRQYHATINGQQVFIAVTLENRGTDTARVRFIRVAPLSSSTKWSASTADAIAHVFLPPDAKFQKDANVADFGKEHIYVSASLGASFPADYFTLAADGSQVTPGTHYYSCGNTDEPQGGCSMQTGAL